MGKACGTYEREEICVQVSVGKPKLKRILGRPWLRWGISQMILEKQDRRGWNGFIWLRIGANGVLM